MTPPTVLTVLPDFPLPAITGLQLRLLAILEVVRATGAQSHAIYFEHGEARGAPAELASLCQSVVSGGRTQDYATFSVRRRIAQRVSFVSNALLRRVGRTYPFSVTYDAIGAGAAIRAEAARVEADVVVLPSFLGHYAPALLRDGRRVIADAVDVQGVQSRELLAAYGPRAPHRLPGLIANHLGARSQDKLVVPLCDEVWANSEPQARELRRLAQGKPVIVIANVLDGDAIRPLPPPNGARVGFIGNYAYAPNLDAAIHLVEGILPRLAANVPAARLALAGGGIPADRAATWNADARVEVLGRVADAAEFVGSCRALCFPLYFESGPPLKVVEALAHGRPVVVSRQIAAALGLRHLHDALVAARDEDAADHLGELLTDELLARSLAERGRETFETRFSLASAVAQACAHSLLAGHARPTTGGRRSG